MVSTAMLMPCSTLGAQAANLMLDIADHGWSLAPAATVQLPLSTTTTIDSEQARARFALRPSALSQVDNVLER
jgi:hypothetical protein